LIYLNTSFQSSSPPLGVKELLKRITESAKIPRVNFLMRDF